jgi:hypothetical protein
VELVIASVGKLANVTLFKNFLEAYRYKVLVIDEGNTRVRSLNEKLLSKIPCTFYGPLDRKTWFKQRFGSAYRKYLSLIPERCHAETSFGFLVAYEDEPDFVVELDDDVFPLKKTDILGGHMSNLFNDDGVTVRSRKKWYNTLDNLELNTTAIFPRGHPYTEDARVEDYTWISNGGCCSLNMGLWAGHPDLDALTILYHGGLKGRCGIEGKALKKKKIVVGKSTYFSLCSMNTSFLPRIIPAFYQLYMNSMGIDRFDDIWSGLFLKKIADHLNEKICLGAPLAYHSKQPRDVFRDAKKEMEGVIINETLWRMVDHIDLEGKNYWDCYASLVGGLEKNLNLFEEMPHRKFIRLQIEKMRLWLDLLDKLK